METITARYHYDGRAWVVSFDDLELSTWGRTLTKARQYAREALAVALDYDSVEHFESALAVEDRYDIDEDFARLSEERRHLEQWRADLEQRTADAARLLVDKGLSTRDTATILGVSHARVHQLLGRERVA